MKRIFRLLGGAAALRSSADPAVIERGRYLAFGPNDTGPLHRAAS